MVGVGIYVKNSPAAIALYQSAFDAELGYHVLNEDGTYFHSSLSRYGEPFLSVVEAKGNTYAEIHPIELGVEFDSREKLERAFSMLSEGGRVDMGIRELPWSPCAATVIDRYGVRWFLSLPQHQPADDWSSENFE